MKLQVGATITLNAIAYELIKHIGEGSQGYVYKATRCNDGKLVAIKFEKQYFKLKQNSGYQGFSDAEVELLRSLQHPNIVPVLDGGVYDTFNMGGLKIDLGFIVMDFIEGECLHLWSPKNLMTYKEVIELIKTFLEVMQYLLTKELYLADIKAENIIRKSDGTLVLIDLNGAQIGLGNDLPVLTLSATPPEIYRACKSDVDLMKDYGDYREKAMVYAIGALAFYVITNPIMDFNYWLKGRFKRQYLDFEQYQAGYEEVINELAVQFKVLKHLMLKLISSEAGNRPSFATAILECNIALTNLSEKYLKQVIQRKWPKRIIGWWYEIDYCRKSKHGPDIGKYILFVKFQVFLIIITLVSQYIVKPQTPIEVCIVISFVVFELYFLVYLGKRLEMGIRNNEF